MFPKLYKLGLLTIFLFSILNVQAAVKIVECEDEDGNRSFQKICPPNFKTVSEKNIKTATGSDSSADSVNIQATVYLVPDCDTCSEVIEFLNSRKITIIEKNVKDNLDLQNELTKLAGALKVPTTVIGNEILSGYVRKDFINALKEVGYKEGS